MLVMMLMLVQTVRMNCPLGVQVRKIWPQKRQFDFLGRRPVLGKRTRTKSQTSSRQATTPASYCAGWTTTWPILALTPTRNKKLANLSTGNEKSPAEEAQRLNGQRVGADT
jgi:hypothetical protein